MMEESGKNNSTTSATKAKPVQRNVENAEETNRKSKRARRIKNEAAGGGTITSTNDDHTAATISLSELPVDILIKIVKMLPMAQWASLESVNIRFRRAALEAWRSARNIHLDEDFLFKSGNGDDDENGEGDFDCLLEKLVVRSPNIKEITGFAYVGYRRRDQCFRLLRQFKSLERISFAKWDQVTSAEEYRGNDVATFLSQSDNRGNFKEVDISGLCFDSADSQTMNAMESIVQGNDSLKLEKCWCRDTSAGWLNLAGVSLTTLSVVHTRVSPEDLLALINRNDRLERLEFSVSRPDEAKRVVAYTRLFGAIATLTSKNLSVLKIEDQYNGFWCRLHSGLEHLLEDCGRHHRLKKLSLSQLYSCTTRIIDAISNNLTYLTSLSMTITEDCDSASLINLMKKLTGLQKLNIVTALCGPLEGTVVEAVAMNLAELESLKLICHIRGSINLENLGLLTNLKKLHIDAERVDNDVLKAWSGGFGSNLESLTLSGRPRSVLGGLSTLLKKASKLHRLDLGHTPIMDHHLRLVASCCPLLHEFYARQWHPDITARGVQAIIDGCRQLKWLEIGGLGFWSTKQLNVGKYRKINFCKRKANASFGKEG